MPRISSFYGITVAMYFNDHAPPHFHVTHAGSEASIGLDDLRIMEGELSARASRLVRQWARLHTGELMMNWARAREGSPLDTIPGAGVGWQHD